VVFASTLAVGTGKFVSSWCIGEKSQ
jgi:hypothetical protein